MIKDENNSLHLSSINLKRVKTVFVALQKIKIFHKYDGLFGLLLSLFGLTFSVVLTLLSILHFTLPVKLDSDGKSNVTTTMLNATYTLKIDERDTPSLGNSMFLSLGQENRFSSIHIFTESSPVGKFLSYAIKATLIPASFIPVVNQTTDYNPKIKGSITYYIFNPFRAKLTLNPNYVEGMLFAINIPDRSIEVWQSNNVLERIELKVPWTRLILSGLGIPLGMSIFIFSFIYLVKQLWQSVTSLFTRVKGKVINPKKQKGKLTGKLAIYSYPLPMATLWFVIGIVTVGYIFLNQVKAMPGFGDEMNYLFQGKIFSQGKTWIQQPEDPDFFNVGWMSLLGEDKRIWNFHPPGNSIFLAIGWAVNHPEFVPPVIFGVVMLVQYLLAYNLSRSNLFAHLYCAVFISSHYVLSLASSYMAHSPSLLFISATYLFSLYYLKNKNPRWIMLVAITSGISFLIRPLSAFLGLAPMLTLVGYVMLKARNFKYILLSSFIFISIASFAYIYTYSVSGVWELSYLVKGSEVGNTLSQRLKNDWDWRLSNAFRNINEFQHRSHVLGFSNNMVFAFVSIFLLWKTKYKKPVLFGTFAFWFYVVVHSFIHWYGWRWEPRMIYDISFVHYLLFAGGLYGIYLNLHTFIKPIFAFLCFIFFITILYVDVPKRYFFEYQNYNSNNPQIGEYIRKNKIKNAIIFFRNEVKFAPYFPFNSLTFDGDIIYAIDQGKILNQKLINKYPTRSVYFSEDGISLRSEYNYFLDDYNKLQAHLLRGNISKSAAYIIVPNPSAIEKLKNDPNNQYVHISEQNLLEQIASQKYSDRSYSLFFAFVAESKYLLNVFNEEKIPYKIKSNLGLSNTQLIEVPAKTKFNLKKKYGFEKKCYANTGWIEPNSSLSQSSYIDISDCKGENTSIYLKGYIDAGSVQQLNIYSLADDGLRISIDDQIIHDNHFENGGSAGRVETGYIITPGKHKIEIYYYNKPGIGYLEIGTVKDSKDTPIHGKISDSLIYH